MGRGGVRGSVLGESAWLIGGEEDGWGFGETACYCVVAWEAKQTERRMLNDM